MNSRPHRSGAPASGSSRPSPALMHRAPQGAMHAVPPAHAPNAALLIDFDNVTMGIQKDLHTELRKLLSSEIIRGKVAVQRAYADWRRYPQYIVPLAESSIDMIMAPAYGSSKKNATDIRLAIDALELVFTRPEIGTFILLSGDSDFSSLVIKLKEYGKYVIGVGIRESSSDLLVMNCDEYYSWNALTGLVKTDEDEPSRKYDPWELVTEAVQRMKRNGDVMRSDRLKQVMQEIDASFDEKEFGYSKFSRFCQEAAGKGLLSISKLENGQLEVDVPGAAPASAGTAATAAPAESPRAERDRDEEGEERGGRRGRRGRGRGRDRDREPRDAQARDERPRDERPRDERPREERPREGREERPRHEGQGELRLAAAAAAIGTSGERLTREEAFDLVRRATAAATSGDQAARADDVRGKARELLGRDSESLSERNFSRILRDAHDAEVIDLRRRGDDFEVARAAESSAAAEQPKAAEPAAPAAPATPALPRGVGLSGRGVGPRGRAAAIPPELLSIGIVPVTPTAPAAPAAAPAAPAAEAKAPSRPAAKKGGRGGAAKKSAAKKSAASAAAAPAAPPAPPAAPAPKAKRATKTAAKQAPAAKGGGKAPGRAAKSAPSAKREGKAPRTAE